MMLSHSLSATPPPPPSSTQFDEFAAGKAQTATFDNDVFLAIRLFSLLSHIKPDLRISLGTGAWFAGAVQFCLPSAFPLSSLLLPIATHA